MTALDTLAVIAHQAWREQAACSGAWRDGIEFVDPAPADVADIIRDYCHRCRVVGQCRSEGDRGAPYKLLTIMGARAYGKGEPLHGWEVAS